MGIGRAAVLDSGTVKATPAKSIFDRITEEDQERKRTIEKLEQDKAKLHQTNRDLRGKEEQPLIKLINLDFSFALIGTLAQLVRSVFSGLTGSMNTNDPNTTKTRGLDIFDDILHKVRQQAQYSIHAQPGLNLRDPDDISSDAVENMVTANLGSSVYKFHAFIAPWVGLFKMFFPYSDNPIMGLLPRLVDSLDNSMGKLTNIFWNMRRIGKAFVAYDGGIKSSAFTEKQLEVRKVISFYWDNQIKKIFNLFYRNIFRSKDPVANINLSQIITHEEEQDIERIKNEMGANLENNFKAMISPTYKCVHEGGIQKRVGEEEPQNQKWYVRMKIASKCLGLPAGTIAGLSNVLGIGLNVIGSVFNAKRIRSLSDKCTDFANGLMSLVYLTGEVPANLNEYFRKKNYENIVDPRNLIAFGIGLLGMVNRIKDLPVFNRILSLTQIKPILDKFDKPLRHFFLLFFSYNRLVLHSTERKTEEAKASNQDLEEASKHNNLWSHITLPLRVLMGDDQVTYSKQSYNRSDTLIPTVVN